MSSRPSTTSKNFFPKTNGGAVICRSSTSDANTVPLAIMKLLTVRFVLGLHPNRAPYNYSRSLGPQIRPDPRADPGRALREELWRIRHFVCAEMDRPRAGRVRSD